MLLFLIPNGIAVSQSSDGNRVQNEAEVAAGLKKFGAELDRIARICGEADLSAEQLRTERWRATSREDLTVLYLPEPLESLEVKSPALKGWAQAMNAARLDYADVLFAEAERLVESDESPAYRKLWHVLRENPDHEKAKAILGTVAQGTISRSRLVRGRAPIPDFGWAVGSYSQVDSPHFSLLTRADARSSRKLATQLEQFYALWSQVFFELWARPGTLAARMKGRSSAWSKHPRIEVVLLRDREEYLKVLGVAENNIGVSVGYYNPNVKRCFFYPGQSEKELTSTVFHELTHQLLMEASQIVASPTAGNEADVWLLEGVAMYMESLSYQASYWVLGGVDAPRIQSARYRGVRDGYWPEWDSFTSAGIEDWKQTPDIARLYSHAAGITHCLFDLCGEETRRETLKSLVAIYTSDQPASMSASLLEHLGASEEQAKLQYQSLLTLSDKKVRDVVAGPREPTELVLTASQLQTETWQALAALSKLTWLDVAFSNANDEALSWLGSPSEARTASEARSASEARTASETPTPRLQRLSLEGAPVSGQLLSQVTNLKELRELDLSYVPVDDAALAKLVNATQLEVLWLTETKITEQSLETLARLTKLKQCDVSGTGISDAAWKAFVAKHPSLK